jgi:hypothetical protein
MVASLHFICHGKPDPLECRKLKTDKNESNEQQNNERVQSKIYCLSKSLVKSEPDKDQDQDDQNNVECDDGKMRH